MEQTLFAVRASAEVLRSREGATRRRGEFQFGKDWLYFHALPAEIAADKMLSIREVPMSDAAGEIIHGLPLEAPMVGVPRAGESPETSDVIVEIPDDLETLNGNQLRKLAAALKLDTQGKRDDLLERIQKHVADTDADLNTEKLGAEA